MTNNPGYRDLTDSQRSFLETLLSPERLDRLKSVLKQRLSCVTLVLDNLLDSHNMAAVVRTVESLGCQDLHVIEEDYPFDLSSRVTKYTHKWVSIHRYPDAPSCMDQLRSDGFRVYAAMVDNQSMPITEIEITAHQPIAFVLGNEHSGVRPETLALTDGGFYVPMYGFSESFNVSVASALVLSHAVTRRRQFLPCAHGTLPADRAAKLYDIWLQKSVKNSQRLLKSVD